MGLLAKQPASPVNNFISSFSVQYCIMTCKRSMDVCVCVERHTEHTYTGLDREGERIYVCMYVGI